jgi:hypothetical protein
LLSTRDCNYFLALRAFNVLASRRIGNVEIGAALATDFYRHFPPPNDFPLADRIGRPNCLDVPAWRPFPGSSTFFGLLPGHAAFGELFPEDHYPEQEPVLRKDSQAKVF